MSATGSHARRTHAHEGLAHRISTQPAVYTLFQHAISLNYRVIRRRLRRFLLPGLEYLDVACGTGSLYPTVRDNGGRYLGVDIDPDAIAYARRRFPGPDFRVMDAREVAALGRSFTRVFSVALLHHLDDAGAHAALAAIRSLLPPDGRYLVIDAIPPRDRWNIIGAALRRLDNGAFVRRADEYRTLLERHFVVLEEDEFGQFPLDYVAYELRPCLADES